ncbi:RNA-binding protein-like RNA recognition motif protein [Tasmannia lanceolata]|uniref:RNA-binding protein-like RNA recognition motif protein n=1 Tax=Tasmannia lanceolata TaxID=3420 RepID=UPI00406373FB
MDQNNLIDEKCETRLYVGNLDQRITESHLIKMFSPFGKIVSEDFLWHTRGPRCGEPRGFAFIQFSSREEAQLAKEKMDGRFACGRPLVVRLASEKYLIETPNAPTAIGEAKKSMVSSCPSGQMSRSAKIAAIKNKLKSMEEENPSTKKSRQAKDVI